VVELTIIVVPSLFSFLKIEITLHNDDSAVTDIRELSETDGKQLKTVQIGMTSSQVISHKN